jgi:YhcH/YjgK/YiaL family protein
MILDHLDYHKLYTNLNARFEKAFEFLLTTDFENLAHDKYNLDGDEFFVIYMEYETKSQSECLLENHKKYIDIQYIVDGEELIGISTFNGQVASVPYDENKDIAFYNDGFDTLLRLSKGHFAIFFPHDLHMPCLKVSEPRWIKKAVCKIRVD